MKTIVLFETFIRVEYARRVFDAIKSYKPEKLYFYSNKPKSDKPQDLINNETIRSWVNEVDWNCELHTYFRSEYVDVYTSLRSAIDWVFQNEEYAIILEDDCVPTPAFFEFCNFFLEKYKNEKRICAITGDNYIKDYTNTDGDHIITRTFLFYGWATWRDRWQSIQWENDYIADLKKGYIENYYSDKNIIRNRYELFTNKAKFLQDTYCWDYIFVFNAIKRRQYVVAPNYHLVNNIGTKGTHTKNGNILNTITASQLNHYPFLNTNKDIKPDESFDYATYYMIFKKDFSWRNRLKKKIKNIFKKTILQNNRNKI